MAILAMALALQLQVAGVASGAAGASPFAESDSLRDAERAHGAQAWFERHRRTVLPWGFGSDGRCDARIGRFCWWYDESATAIPPEPEAISHSRSELLANLDAIARRHPGDAWATGMRVYYHVEAHELALADSAAHECHASGWWCQALRGFSAHARGAHAEADSSFAQALRLMPDTLACRWRNIATLLPGDLRSRYEKSGCAARAPIESRYWLLSVFRLGVPGNEWRAEYLSRRVIAELASRGVTPHPLGWGDDATELLLRYGWPVGWSREQPSGVDPTAFNIVGHDPTPSFPVSPREALFADDASGADDDWDLNDRQAPSRYATREISRVVPLAAQIARFIRDDSTLVVAAFAGSDDSLRTPVATLAAGNDSGIVRSESTTGRVGRLRIAVAGEPRLLSVELSDSATRTLARARRLLPSRHDRTVPLSDLLLFRGETEGVAMLDDALAGAIPGDTVSRDQPVGIFWETYDATGDTAARELSILVERVDHGIFKSVRQRLGLSDPDSPIRVRWSEPRPAEGGRTSRAIALDLSALPAGRYRVTLAAAVARGAEHESHREISLRDH